MYRRCIELSSSLHRPSLGVFQVGASVPETLKGEIGEGPVLRKGRRRIDWPSLSEAEQLPQRRRQTRPDLCRILAPAHVAVPGWPQGTCVCASLSSPICLEILI